MRKFLKNGTCSFSFYILSSCASSTNNLVFTCTHLIDMYLHENHQYKKNHTEFIYDFNLLCVISICVI